MNTPVFTLPSRYLGLPLSDSAARNISWDSLPLSITNHLSNWTFQFSKPSQLTSYKP